MALGLCICVRLVVWLVPDSIQRFHGGVNDRDFLAAEYNLRSTQPHLVVAVMGSSVLYEGVSASLLASELGLEPEGVASGAFRGGTAYDAVLMLRRDPGLFGQLHLLIIDAQLWQFNDRSWEFRSPHSYRYASLRDRMGIYEFGYRAVAVADWFWPFVSERRQLRQWLAGHKSVGPLLPPRRRQPNADFAPATQARRQSERFHFSVAMATAWHELLAFTEQRGVNVLLVQPPKRAAYQDWIDKNATAAYRQYLSFVHSLDGPGVAVHTWERPDEIGLSDDSFYDYGHMSEDGAARFTRFLATMIRREGLLLPAGRSPSQPVASP